MQGWPVLYDLSPRERKSDRNSLPDNWCFCFPYVTEHGLISCLHILALLFFGTSGWIDSSFLHEILYSEQKWTRASKFSERHLWVPLVISFFWTRKEFSRKVELHQTSKWARGPPTRKRALGTCSLHLYLDRLFLSFPLCLAWTVPIYQGQTQALCLLWWCWWWLLFQKFLQSARYYIEYIRCIGYLTLLHLHINSLR